MGVSVKNRLPMLAGGACPGCHDTPVTWIELSRRIPLCAACAAEAMARGFRVTPIEAVA